MSKDDRAATPLPGHRETGCQRISETAVPIERRGDRLVAQMSDEASYFQEGGIAYARWASADWKESSPKCPYSEGEGAAAREWRSGFRHWFYLDYGSPRIWTEEAIERIRKK